MDIKEFIFRDRPRIKRIIALLWILFLSVVILLPLYIYTVKIDLFGLYGNMPSLAALENPENDLSSEVFTADGVSIGRYYRYNRSQVTYEQLSPELVTTLISSEDHRFYEHSGIDFRSLARAIVGKLTGKKAGGGSTLTMQLAENLFNTMDNSGLLYKIPLVKDLVIKTKEWIISAQLERNFTKKEILAMYLNTVEWSSNSYGIKIAAETYFGKQPDSLNYQESAVLVGMLQAITRFNPAINMDNSISKRNEVLYKLYKYEVLSREEYDSIKELPIDLSKYNVSSHNKGMATYFRSVLRDDLMAWCEENGYDLWEDGLKIHTTIDSRMQQYMEEAMVEHMAVLQEQFMKSWKGRNPWIDDDKKEIKDFLERRIKQTDTYRNLVKKYGKGNDSIDIVLNTPRKIKIFTWQGEVDSMMSPIDSLAYFKHFLHTGFMSMDPHTGQIKSWVGGIDHKYFQYDHVKQGKRQPGSTFKTFVYGLAMENNYSPCRELLDYSPTFSTPTGPWRAFNADGTYGSGEKMTLRQAMARSVNSITAQVMKELTPENVVNFAKKFGIKSPLDPVPSLCLGTSDVSVFEMVGAYSAFANKGVYIEPYYITRIEDKNGNVIENFPLNVRNATDENTAYKILYMLRGGIEERGGTSGGLSWEVKKDNQIGGKTGTTNNASDGWYMGVTKDLVAGGWVGGDERNIHFRSWADGSGGKTARPIWDLFMQKVYNDPELNITRGSFPVPKEGLDIELDCSLHHLDSDSAVVVEKPWNPDGF